MSAEPTASPEDTDLVQNSADWSPERQMARLLDLCEAQMDAALTDSDRAVDTLVQAFTQLVGTTRALSNLVKDLPVALKEHAAAADIDERCEAISNQVAAAIVAFQFYDKLTQRMGHVRYSLSALALFICERHTASQPEHWRKLVTTLRKLYRTEEERVVFEAVAEGASIEAVAQIPAAPDNSTSHIELF